MSEINNVQWMGRGESANQPETEHRLQYAKEGVKGQLWLRAIDRESIYEPRYITSAIARSLAHFSLGVGCQVVAILTAGTAVSSWGLGVILSLMLANILHAAWQLYGSGSPVKRVRAFIRITLTFIGFCCPISLFWS